MSLLVAENLHFAYNGVSAVTGLSLEVEAGEVLGFLGPNGAGKTTTMNMLSGLLSPDSGSIRFHGELVDFHQPEERRRLGIAPQDVAIYPDLSGAENLAFFGSLYGLRGEQLRERVDMVLDETGLADQATKHAGAYSGGMKRRLNFGCAILHQPEILILDEATVGVDPQSRNHLLECVQRQADAGTAVIYASHYMEEVETLCRRVVIIDHAKEIAHGSLSELLSQLRPQLQFVCPEMPKDIASRLESIPGVDKVFAGPEEGQIIIDLDPVTEDQQLTSTMSATTNRLKELNLRVRSFGTRDRNLEQLFLELTGRSLRD